MTFFIEPLGEHSLENFTSGNEELDEWLANYAHTATGHGTRTYVLVDVDRLVVGYFAVAPHLLRRKDAPSRIARGAPENIPAVLLAKLALDSSVQGQGLGSELLVAALGVILDAARRVGGKVVVVDAIDDGARSFYERHEFVRFPGQSHRLLMKLSVVAKTFGVAWP